MDIATIVDDLKARLPEVPVEVVASVDFATVRLPAGGLVDTCRVLRDAHGFNLLAEVTAVDYWPSEPRFETVYHLVAIEPKRRLRLKVRIPGSDPRVPTVSTIWPSAGFPEREVFDLFGITFEGHPDLRRILMPDDWDGFPLRKDYPVQVKVPVKTTEPLQLTEDEFKANVARDRSARSAPPR